MGQRTLRNAVLQSVVSSGGVVVVLATVSQTAETQVFDQFRSGLNAFLAHPFGFWLLLFTFITLLILISILAVNHSRRAAIKNPILSQDGVLLFDREQHIAFSIRTLKSLLVKLSAELQDERAHRILYAAGEAAGRRFGSNFETIYADRIEAEHLKRWETLSDHEKLEAWERYDATAGWGRIAVRHFKRNCKLEVIITHPSLFEDEGGAIFSWLLIGYCREVASTILNTPLRFNGDDDVEFDEGIVSVSFYHA